MNSLLQILVLLGFMVAGAVMSRLRLAPRAAITDRVIKVVLWALLFVMGFRLGNEESLRGRLPEIGALAIGSAVMSIIGTVLAIRLAYAMHGRWRKRQGADSDGKAAEWSALTAGDAGTEPEAVARHGGGLSMSHFKAPAILLGFVIAGFVAGVVAPPSAFDYGRVTGWVLNALLFMIGIQFAQSGLSLKAAFVRVDTVLVPAATVVGTLLGALVVAALYRLSVGKALALSAGFGWYTLSGVLISDLGDPLLGSAAFLANMARESLAFVLIPLLSATAKPYAAIGVGGATAMDVTLPLVEQCLGPDSVPVSFTSGATLSLLVPVLVPLFYSLPF